MVEDEKRRYRPSKNYLEHLPALNISAFEVINFYFKIEYFVSSQSVFLIKKLVSSLQCVTFL